MHRTTLKRLALVAAMAALLIGLPGLGTSSALAGGRLRPATGSLIQFATMYNGRCLNADSGGGGANGTRVQLWDCYGTSNDLWYFDADSTGALYIRSAINGRCLNVDTNGGGGNGSKVQLWDCYDYTPADEWVQTYDSNGQPQYRNVYSGRCLNADTSAGGANGSKIQVWDCYDGTTNEEWY
jgi:hypothetical protein